MSVRCLLHSHPVTSSYHGQLIKFSSSAIFTMASQGSGFLTQVAIYEQGYSNSFTFALALCRDGTAAGYLRFPYILVSGHSIPGSAAEINTP